MKNEALKNIDYRRKPPAIVLLLTLVLLVALSTIGYTLASRIAAQRHRDHYLIDYQNARYGCDSAIKYALATLDDINTPPLIARPNEPDFSDIFSLSEQDYEQFIEQWSLWFEQTDIADTNRPTDANDPNVIAEDGTPPSDIGDINDPNFAADVNAPAPIIVRGPYGSLWPFIAKPIEIEIGSAKVTIKIEDENAKYPVGWLMLNDPESQREILAGFKTFCDWMDVNEIEFDPLIEQFERIKEIKTFKLAFKPMVITKKEQVTSKTTRTRGRGRRPRIKTRKITIPATSHIADFAKLLHSPLIDAETLARPTIVSDNRKESALKYLGMWGSNKVNINTAPRHVLEAAFVFGGDEVEIADEIIERRRHKPFADIEDLKKVLLEYSVSIRKSEKYITTVSNFFTIKVTATSGVASASAVIAIIKQGAKTEKIAVIDG